MKYLVWDQIECIILFLFFFLVSHVLVISTEEHGNVNHFEGRLLSGLKTLFAQEIQVEIKPQ